MVGHNVLNLAAPEAVASVRVSDVHLHAGLRFLLRPEVIKTFKVVNYVFTTVSWCV